MKKIFLLFFAMSITLSSFAVVNGTDGSWHKTYADQPEMQELSPEMVNMGIKQFLELTPKKYRKMTGERLGLAKSIKLKAAQKFLKKKLKKEPEISSGLYVLLAILGLAWAAMGVMDDWKGNTWIVNLILTALCWLPGLIHALVKRKDYYGGRS